MIDSSQPKSFKEDQPGFRAPRRVFQISSVVEEVKEVVILEPPKELINRSI